MGMRVMMNKRHFRQEKDGLMSENNRIDSYTYKAQTDKTLLFKKIIYIHINRGFKLPRNFLEFICLYCLYCLHEQSICIGIAIKEKNRPRTTPYIRCNLT